MSIRKWELHNELVIDIAVLRDLANLLLAFRNHDDAYAATFSQFPKRGVRRCNPIVRKDRWSALLIQGE